MKLKAMNVVLPVLTVGILGLWLNAARGGSQDTLYYHISVVCDQDTAVRAESGGPAVLGKLFSRSFYVWGNECLGVGSGGESWLSSFAQWRNVLKKLPRRLRERQTALTPEKAPKTALEMLCTPARTQSGAFRVQTILCEFRLQRGRGKRLTYEAAVTDTVYHLLPGHTYRIATLTGDCPRTHSVYLRLDETKPPPTNELTQDFQNMLRTLKPASIPVNFYIRYEQHDSATGEIVLLQTTKQINFDPQRPFVLRFLTPSRVLASTWSVEPEYRIVGYLVPLQKDGDSLRCKLLLQQALGLNGKFTARAFTAKSLTLASKTPLRVVLFRPGLRIGVPTSDGQQTFVSLRRDLLKGVREELYITAYF